MTEIIRQFAAAGKAGTGFAWMWLGQGGFAYRFDAVTVVVDPYLSDAVTSLPRAYPREAEPSDIAGDLLLATHGHDDHFDPETVEYAVRQRYMAVAGPQSCQLLYGQMQLPDDRFIELNCGESLAFHGVAIAAVKAEHDSVPGRSDAVGYVLRGAGVTVYHVGDCAYMEEIAKQTAGLKPDYLVVPINGKWGNMNAREAALLAKTTQAAAAIPMHYDMFVGNQEDPRAFVREVRALEVKCEVVIPQRWVISAGG